MTFNSYARLVTEQIRRTYPDATASIGKASARWRRGEHVLSVDARDRRTWWVSFGRALVFDERHNAESAAVTAQNAISHLG